MKTNLRIALIIVITITYLFLVADAMAVVREYPSDDVNVEISDIDTTYSDIFVLDSMMIADVNVVLNIQHSFFRDLDVFLVHDGVTVELFTDIAGDGDRDPILDDECNEPIADGIKPSIRCYKPEGKLSAFDGLDAYGDWELIITDDERGDTGELESWSLILELCSYPENPSPPDKAKNVSIRTCLSWDAGADPNTTSWDLYLGKDPNEMVLIETDLSEPNYCPCGLNPFCGLETWTKYYWSVVAKTPSCDKVPVKKDYWSFHTECPIDLNHDRIIDINDVDIFIDKWLETIDRVCPL